MSEKKREYYVVIRNGKYLCGYAGNEKKAVPQYSHNRSKAIKFFIESKAPDIFGDVVNVSQLKEYMAKNRNKETR